MSNNARVIKYLKETLERIDRIESVCKNAAEYAKGNKHKVSPNNDIER